MESWRRLAVLGLLVGFFAGGCVITSGDDDDDDSSSSAGSGGTDEGSGGSDSSSGGSDTGSGGAAGGTSDGGAGPCEQSIADNCGTEWAACTGDCLVELDNAQICLRDIINTSGQPTATEQSECAEAAGIDGDLITTPFSDLFGCMWCNEAIADLCLGGFDDPIDCVGAGGAGG